VHFAVSNRDVMMTKLAGGATRFLPFNRETMAARAIRQWHGLSTAYLWQEVWRDSWLEILGRYLIAKRDKKKQISGIIFPATTSWTPPESWWPDPR
jgi:type I restriction enzyme R subunit